MQGNMQKNTEDKPPVPSPGYETRDTNARAVLGFALVLFLTVVGAFVSMRGLFAHYSVSQQLGPAASPFDSDRALPPEPRLQVDPKVDLQQVRESQEEILRAYGWVDKAGGKVRVPIDRAMDMLIAHGLPTRANGTASPVAASGVKEQAK
jgi:hypothetical protein